MTKTRWSTVSKGAMAMMTSLAVACHGGGVTETGGNATVEVTTQALTSVDIDRVLGFEAATVTDWAIIQSGPGTLSVSTTASEGSRSLAVASHGYVPVQSVALTSLGSRVGSAIHYDIMLPTELKQISPKNYGATQLYLNSTSLGLNNTYLGQVDLTPLPVGQWNTVTFTPTSAVLAKLRGTYSDLRVTIVVNAPYNATKPYLLDNLRFSDSTLALVTVVDGGGHPLSGLTVVAYNSATPTTNTGVTDSTGLAKVWVPTGSYRFAVTEAGVTTYSSPTNQCQVPGVCTAVTITAKCHGIVCTAKDTCHSVGICDPGMGTCSNPAKPAGTVCRPVAGLCDVAEVCDGSDAGCPVDAFLQASLACRPAAGLCDAAEYCTGTSAACPPDVFQTASTICRVSTGACDPAETCTGTSTSCPTDVVIGPPTVPSGLSATSGSGQVSLAWSASPGATNYNVKRSTTSGGSYTTVASPTLTSFIDTGLTSGTTYYYVVTAVGACGESANSNEGSGIPQATTGVTPTLNCVTQINSSTYGAVYGYINTTGANVTLGAGPHNFFSPGPADLGQPILFVPGQVPIATFQLFQINSNLTYTIGQQSVVASANSPTCSAGLTTALLQLFADTSASAALRQQTAALIANPKYAAWIATTKSAMGPQLSPFQSSLLDAAALVAANADLLGDPATLSPAQLARVPGFRTSLLSNAAIILLRLTGDALRADSATIPCNVTNSINANQAAAAATAPQSGSLYAQTMVLAQSPELASVESTIAAVATGAHSAALLAVPGFLLASFQSLSALERLQLSGAPIPTGFWSVVGGIVGGAIVGACVGFATGGPYGAIVGGAAGAVAGGITCAVSTKICDKAFGDDCQQCTTDFSCGNEVCVDGCCSGTSIPAGSVQFLLGPVGCSGGATSCEKDGDCGSGSLCVEGCCLNPQTYAGRCTGDTCSVDSDCLPGNSCLYGCCLGNCGFDGTSCATVASPASCSGTGGTYGTCPSGSSCTDGCCWVISY